MMQVHVLVSGTAWSKKGRKGEEEERDLKLDVRVHLGGMF